VDLHGTKYFKHDLGMAISPGSDYDAIHAITPPQGSAKLGVTSVACFTYICSTGPHHRMTPNNLFYLPVLFIFPVFASAQNMVPNWSFEDHAQCPDYWNEVERASGWHKSMNNNNNQHHTDYCNACGISNFNVPTNILGTQSAATGNAYMLQAPMAPSIMTDYRENIYIQLIAPLEIGQDYDVHFKISSADMCQHSSNNQGVKFSTVPNFPIDGVCQVHSTAILTEHTNWVEISGSFTADSAYNYICVGNFLTDAQTTSGTPCPSCSSPLYSYYLDDVCVLAKHSNSGDCSVAYFSLGIDGPSSPTLTFQVISNDPGLTVLYPRPLPEDGTLNLHDMDGRLIRSVRVLKGSLKNEIRLEGLARGAYLVRLNYAGRQAVQRFIRM
jgi:hypothetical protein